jgi:hypothetical protein
LSDPIGDLVILSIMWLELSIIAVICFIWSGLICPIMFIIPAWSPIIPWVLGGCDGGWASWAYDAVAAVRFPAIAAAVKSLVSLPVVSSSLQRCGWCVIAAA